MKNSDVISAWLQGRPTSTLHLHTDGMNLYSYRLLIGYRNKVKHVIDYMGEDMISMTTSKHVGLAKRAGAMAISRKEFLKGGI